jgi:uncharacterized membrane protein (UPF0127 family)
MTVVRTLTILLSLALVAGGACGGEEESQPTTTVSSPGTTTETAPATTSTEAEESGPTVLIETSAGDEVVVPVEIADTPDEREVGLMNRPSLPEDAGMIFLFDDDTSGGFWMKDTLVPLSIAFVDADGTIVSILDMDPCEADPCEIYDPGVTYRSALEVNQGAFGRWGVQEGDRLTLRS